MAILEKYNVKFLDLKDKVKTPNSLCSIKIFHIINTDVDNINHVKKLLRLPPNRKEGFFGEQIYLHNLGTKANGQEQLIRCSVTRCQLCSLGSENISRYFFYGIVKNEIVYFSLDRHIALNCRDEFNDFKPTLRQACNAELTDITNQIYFNFRQGENNPNLVVLERLTVESETRQYSAELLDEFKKLPPLKYILDEKYPEVWDAETQAIIKSLV